MIQIEMSESRVASEAEGLPAELIASLMTSLLRGVLVVLLFESFVVIPFLAVNKVAASWMSAFALVALIAVPYALLRQQRPLLSAYVFLLNSAVVATSFVLLGRGGVSSMGSTLQLAIVGIAVVIVGRRFAAWIAVTCLAADLAVAAAEFLGYSLPKVFPGQPLAVWFSFAADFLLLAWVLDRVIRALLTQLQERRQAEASLRESEERFRTVMEQSPDVIALIDARGVLIYISHASKATFGFTPDEMTGCHFENFLAEHSLPSAMEAFHRTMGAGIRKNSIELSMKRKDGTLFVGELEAKRCNDGPEPAILILIRDISERRRAEEVQAFLAHAGSGEGGESFFDSLTRYLATSLQMDLVSIGRLKENGSHVKTVSLWVDGQFRDNKTYALEYTPCAEAVQKASCGFGKDVRHLFPADMVLQDMKAECYVGTTLCATDGKAIGLLAVVGRIPLENTQVVEAVLAQVSVRAARELERMHVEHTLRENEALLNETGRVAKVGGWKMNIATKKVTWTREVFRIHEVDDGFIPSVDSVKAFYLPESWTIVQRAAEGALQHRESFDLELEIVTARNNRRTIHTIGGPLMSDDGMLFIGGTLQDITEQKQQEKEKAHLQDQLSQAQKMESIGRLAGGVAHEFNNLLTVINGYSDFLLNRLPVSDPLHGYVSEISKAGDSAASLTRQLLAFGRKQVFQPRPLNLNSNLRSFVAMLKRLIGEDVQLVATLDDSLGQVMLDPDQFHQIMMNVALNARDAMPSGGTLAIATANVDLDSESAALIDPDATAGPYVLVRINDTGRGMDEKTRQRIFEPFFTTKAVGEGTGLGLATVYGIVRQNEGWIDVYSEVGTGTSFQIYLPRMNGRSCPEQNGIATFINGGGETVLLVEDQEAVRLLVKDVLEERGYKVIVAADGIAAIAAVSQHPVQIHLLLTDVILPVMNGKMVHEKLMGLLPNLPAIYISGYPADVIAQRGMLEPEAAFLQKPFSPDALVAKVRQVLNHSSAP